MAKKTVDFEKSLQRLEEIVENLETGDETLENTLKLYEEGLKMSANCKDALENAKQKITVLEKNMVK